MNNRRCIRFSYFILAASAVALGASATSAHGQTPASPPPFTSQPLRPAPQAPLPTGTFVGGVPSGTATGEVLTITVVEAIVRALEHNLGVLTAEQAVGR